MHLSPLLERGVAPKLVQLQRRQPRFGGRSLGLGERRVGRLASHLRAAAAAEHRQRSRDRALRRRQLLSVAVEPAGSRPGSACLRQRAQLLLQHLHQRRLVGQHVAQVGHVAPELLRVRVAAARRLQLSLQRADRAHRPVHARCDLPQLRLSVRVRSL